ncbi:MAG: ABC transporter transmembrane domain-containing protein, partial [Alphaproteobacteria bacterium]
MSATYTMPTPDTLQNALMFLMMHYKKRHSLTSLLNGLPLEKNKLTAHLFIRAAKRAGLNAKVVDRAPADISPYTLPAVVFLKNETFAVLQAKTEKGRYMLVDMQTGKENVLQPAEFAEIYGGFTILVRTALPFELLADNFKTGGDWFWSTLGQFKRVYVQVALAALLTNILALVSPLFVMNVYDRVVPNAAFETLWVLAVGVMIAYVFDFIFRQLRAYFIDAAGKGADILLASRIYQQVLNCRLGTRQASAGAFANQLREFETLRDFFTSSTLTTFIDIPFMFLFLFFIGMMTGPLVLIPLLAIPLILGIGLFVQLPLQGVVRQAAHDMDNKHGHLVETINGIETVKSLGTQSQAQGKWEQFVGQSARVGARSRFLAQLGVNAAVLIQNLVTVGVLIWGVYRIDEGLMTMGALVGASMLVGRALAPLMQAVGLFVRFQQSWMALQNLNEIMHLEVERADGQEFVHIKQLKGEVEFRGVSFAYPGAKLESLTNLH